MVTKTQRVAYLRRYLNSLGAELPPDHTDFQEGAIFGRECLFCNEPHSGAPVFKYHPIQQTRQSTGCHACNECDTLIMPMIKKEYPQLFSEDVDIGKTVDFEEGDWGNRQYKINLYNTTEEFDNTVKHYLIHKSDPLLKCYFCGNKAVTVDRTLKVPVSDSHILDGGRVKVCESCSSELWNNEDSNVHIQSKCSYCGAGYLVKRDEFDRRHLNRTVGKHMCPECTYNGIVQEQSKFSVLNDITNENEPYYRFIHKNCDICREPIVLDLTLLHSKLIQIHSIENSRGIRCHLCYIFKIKDVKTQILTSFNDLYVMVYKLDKNWTYKLSKIVNNEEKVLLKPSFSEYRATDLLECINDAINAAELYGKQTELDYE